MDTVFWVQASSRSAMVNGLVAAGAAMGIVDGDDAEVLARELLE